MANLISGKEALIALANGEEVEYLDSSNTFKVLGWVNAMGLETNLFFGGDRYKFRLKPHTITLNGIEVPSCGSNYQEGETIFVLDDCCDERGYIEYSVSGYQYQNSIPKLWWRTEDEIKQVVDALRTIFKTK